MRSKTDEIRLLMETVERFKDEMENKLIKKVAEGQRGWDDPDSISHIRELLVQHLDRGDSQMIDVANLAMMLWYHWRISPDADKEKLARLAKK